MVNMTNDNTIQLCVFDYDDTLMRTRECKVAAVKALAERHYDLTLSVEDIEKHWGIAHHALFENLLGVHGDELTNALTLYEKLDVEFPISPYADAAEALTELASDFSLVIVSSCTKSLIQSQLSQGTLVDVQFDAIFGADETQFHKPSGKVFNELRAQYPDISPSNIMYVGDSQKDMQAADEVGFHFIGLDRNHAETSKMRAAGANVVTSLMAMTDIVLNHHKVMNI